MVNVEPMIYEKITAFKERVEIVSKLNEVIDFLNTFETTINNEFSDLETEINTTLDNKIDEVDTVIDSIEPILNNKQDVLISGTNIKTINNQSILGNGNIKTINKINYTEPDNQGNFNISSDDIVIDYGTNTILLKEYIYPIIINSLDLSNEFIENDIIIANYITTNNEKWNSCFCSYVYRGNNYKLFGYGISDYGQIIPMEIDITDITGYEGMRIINRKKYPS